MQATTYSNIFIRYSSPQSPLADIWVIHGFCESGNSFINIFESELARHFAVYVIDLPGFGASPYCGSYKCIGDYVSAVIKCIEHFSTSRDVFIMGHSFGGVIGTLVCEECNSVVKGFINVEGNLTEADSYFSGWAGEHEDGNIFKERFLKLLMEKAAQQNHFKRYFANAVSASPEAMIVLGKASRELTRNTDAAKRYMALACPCLYLWGDVDTPAVTQKFIRDSNLPNVLFVGSSHWIMVDEAALFYKTVKSFLLQILRQQHPLPANG